MLDLKQLSCFVAAAEEMHFGRAADRLNMTQSTLSRQIQALERELRVELFDRTNRSVKLTLAGKVFLLDAKRILDITSNAVNWASRAWRGEVGSIRLGFTATAAFVDVPTILNHAQKSIPDIKVILKEGTSSFQRDSLLSDVLDVSLLRPPVDRNNFSSMRIRSEKFIAAVHCDDPLSKSDFVSIKDFDGKDFIMYSPDGAGYSFNILTEAFRRHNVHPVMTHHLDQNHSILALVSAGLGVAMVPDALRFLEIPNVVFKEVEPDALDFLEMLMVWRPDNGNPSLPGFLDMCRRIFAA